MKSLSRIPPSLAEPTHRQNPALLLGHYEFLLRADYANPADHDGIDETCRLAGSTARSTHRRRIGGCGGTHAPQKDARRPVPQ